MFTPTLPNTQPQISIENSFTAAHICGVSPIASERKKARQNKIAAQINPSTKPFFPEYLAQKKAAAAAAIQPTASRPLFPPTGAACPQTSSMQTDTAAQVPLPPQGYSPEPPPSSAAFAPIFSLRFSFPPKRFLSVLAFCFLSVSA